MFHSGLKPTNVFMENDAVARRCHQILIQKTHSWVATPQLTTFIRLSSILNPFSFLPLVSLQMDSLLLAIMASWKLLSAILFQDGKQTYKVNLTHIPTCFISMPDSVIRWKKKKINTSECDQKTKTYICLKELSWNQDLSVSGQPFKTDHHFEKNSCIQKPNSILSFIYSISPNTSFYLANSTKLIKVWPFLFLWCKRNTLWFT